MMSDERRVLFEQMTLPGLNGEGAVVLVVARDAAGLEQVHRIAGATYVEVIRPHDPPVKAA